MSKSDFCASQIEAIRAAEKPAKKRKKNEKMAEGERKTRYGRAFEVSIYCSLDAKDAIFV